MSDDEIIRMANEAGWGYEDATRATAELRERIRVLENDAAGEAVVFDTIVAQRDEARAEVERLRADAADFHMAYRMKCDEETKAQAVEIEMLRADAERYRWLRARYRAMSMDMGGNHSWVPDGRVMRELRGPTLNAAIDAALKEPK